MKQTFAQSCEIFRPYPDEIPWGLLDTGVAELDSARVQQDYTRVAKQDGETLGVYVLHQRSELEYELLALTVAEAVRRRGLGRWLVGHAIGLAESKGGRVLLVGPVHSRAARALLIGLGFHESDSGYRFDFLPE